jgi:hypothetical protein
MSESSSEEAIRAKGNRLSVIAMSESSSEEAIWAKGDHLDALPVHEFEASVPPPDCFVSRRLLPRNDEPAVSGNSILPMWTAPQFFTQQMEGAGRQSEHGLILCSDKGEAVAKYSVLSEGRQIFGSKYLQFLPSEEELRREIQKERRLFEVALEEQEKTE